MEGTSGKNQEKECIFNCYKESDVLLELNGTYPPAIIDALSNYERNLLKNEDVEKHVEEGLNLQTLAERISENFSLEEEFRATVDALKDEIETLKNENQRLRKQVQDLNREKDVGIQVLGSISKVEAEKEIYALKNQELVNLLTEKVEDPVAIKGVVEKQKEVERKEDMELITMIIKDGTRTEALLTMKDTVIQNLLMKVRNGEKQEQNVEALEETLKHNVENLNKTIKALEKQKRDLQENNEKVELTVGKLGKKIAFFNNSVKHLRENLDKTRELSVSKEENVKYLTYKINNQEKGSSSKNALENKIRELNNQIKILGQLKKGLSSEKEVYRKKVVKLENSLERKEIYITQQSNQIEKLEYALGAQEHTLSRLKESLKSYQVDVLSSADPVKERQIHALNRQIIEQSCKIEVLSREVLEYKTLLQQKLWEVETLTRAMTQDLVEKVGDPNKGLEKETEVSP